MSSSDAPGGNVGPDVSSIETVDSDTEGCMLADEELAEGLAQLTELLAPTTVKDEVEGDALGVNGMQQLQYDQSSDGIAPKEELDGTEHIDQSSDGIATQQELDVIDQLYDQSSDWPKEELEDDGTAPDAANFIDEELVDDDIMHDGIAQQYDAPHGESHDGIAQQTEEEAPHGESHDGIARQTEQEAPHGSQWQSPPPWRRLPAKGSGGKGSDATGGKGSGGKGSQTGGKSKPPGKGSDATRARRARLVQQKRADGGATSHREAALRRGREIRAEGRAIHEALGSGPLPSNFAKNEPVVNVKRPRGPAGPGAPRPPSGPPPPHVWRPPMPPGNNAPGGPLPPPPPGHHGTFRWMCGNSAPSGYSSASSSGHMQPLPPPLPPPPTSSPGPVPGLTERLAAVFANHLRKCL